MTFRNRLILTTLFAATAAGGLAGCKTRGEIVLDENVGVTAVRSRCPAVGIPDYTGDMTTFRAAGPQTADNIDVVAVMTNVRAQCAENPDKIVSAATFDVRARRTDTRGERQVTLPYFVAVLRGGTTVVSKRVGTVTVSFADGQEKATMQGQATGYIDAAAATLPPEIRDRIMRKRKPGDADAATDPMSDPEVQAAVSGADFELLVGFQLDEKQIAYNATR